jgi:hypothetical protein
VTIRHGAKTVDDAGPERDDRDREIEARRHTTDREHARRQHSDEEAEEYPLESLFARCPLHRRRRTKPVRPRPSPECQR